MKEFTLNWNAMCRVKLTMEGRRLYQIYYGHLPAPEEVHFTIWQLIRVFGNMGKDKPFKDSVITFEVPQ
jgi:hypothetical protein